MGSKKKYRDLLGRNKKFVAGLAALMMCCGAFLASGRLLPDKTVNGDIPLHDGDVLVDSLNVEMRTMHRIRKAAKAKKQNWWPQMMWHSWKTRIPISRNCGRILIWIATRSFPC